ncbi:MAG TPA: DUF3568 family protein [Desulfatiglandales bacterium]|nr:DUF3568 family protein [Desulfatiglandales bacterium]
MRNLGIMFLLFVSVLTLSSCYPLALVAVGGAAGVGGYQYYQDKGVLEARIYHPYRAVWDATLRALEDLGYAIESAQQEPSAGKVMAKGEDNTPVVVTLEYESDSITKAAIRVGHLGDKDASLAIKEQIQKTLPQ